MQYVQYSQHNWLISTVYHEICFHFLSVPEVPVPERVTVDLNGKSAKVSWSKPAGVFEISYLLTLCSVEESDKIVYTKLMWCLFPELQFDTEYAVSISSVLPNGRQSKPVAAIVHQKKKPRVE